MKNRTALYLRLSKDEAGTQVSESIQNQQEFLMGYAKENGLHVIEVFSDDGYSGTNFNRPDFARLLAAVEAGKIDVILTKDLSRLGRDYIQTGYYLEQYFPLHNIRYIAVNDGIDTLCGGVGNDMSPFRAVFNDMYAKDISKKVRTALETKKKCGQFIGSRAPYGYQKSKTDKNKLLPLDPFASTVQEIYALFLKKRSIQSVVDELNKRHIPTASGKAGVSWSDSTVRRILTNPTYAGHLTQNRSRKINYKLNKKVALPQKEWITVQNTHPALVSQEAFDKVQNILSKSKECGRRKRKKHLLSGMVFCAECGSKMSFMYADGHCYMVCGRWRRTPSEHICQSHCIREDAVKNAVQSAGGLAKVGRITVGLHKEIKIFPNIL